MSAAEVFPTSLGVRNHGSIKRAANIQLSQVLNQTEQQTDNTAPYSIGDSSSNDIRQRKRRHPKGPSQTSTLPLPPSTWTYLHLHLVRSSIAAQSSSLDVLVIRALLTQALAQSLGHLGAAIPIDILRVEETGHEAWIRVPRDDGRAVVTALGQFVGHVKEKRSTDGDAAINTVSWRIKGWDDWLGKLVLVGKNGGADLFTCSDGHPS